MNGFEMHGISYLSPSSINLWVAQPALWAMERLLGKRAPVGCAAHRGTAIEAGVAAGLLDPGKPVEECQALALQVYDTKSALSGDPRRAKHRETVSPAVAVGLAELRQYGIPTGMQGKVNLSLPGVPVPFLGFYDFVWEQSGVLVDLKTTDRIPSLISDAHARQTALYIHGTNFEARLAYTSAKNIAVYRLENPADHINAMTLIAQRLERFLRVSADKTELVGMLSYDASSFYFSDPTARALARETYGY